MAPLEEKKEQSVWVERMSRSAGKARSTSVLREHDHEGDALDQAGRGPEGRGKGAARRRREEGPVVQEVQERLHQVEVHERSDRGGGDAGGERAQGESGGI